MVETEDRPWDDTVHLICANGACARSTDIVTKELRRIFEGMHTCTSSATSTKGFKNVTLEEGRRSVDGRVRVRHDPVCELSLSNKKRRRGERFVGTLIARIFYRRLNGRVLLCTGVTKKRLLK